MKSKYPEFSHHLCTQVWWFGINIIYTDISFDMIGICKHERAALVGDTSSAIIVVKINWSCKGVASTNPKLLLTSSNLIVPCGSHFITCFKR